MRLFDISIVLILVLVGGAFALGVTSTQYFKFKDDNVIEEVCEEVIESQIGADIDLTPDSKEL